MSSLIVLPDAAAAADGPLEGKVLMLNTAKQPRFQCYNFVVSRNKPIETVPRICGEQQIRAAILSGVLLDITGQEAAGGAHAKAFSDIDSAVKAKTMSLVSEGEEIGPRVIVGTDSKGNSYVITPKDDADYDRMQEEIRTTGHLRVEKPKPTAQSQMSGLSAITMEDLPLEQPPGE